MLALGKKIHYALISLAYMTGRRELFVSAREIAESGGLPLPALMRILKTLHTHGVLRSTRGVKGGYQISANLDELSLYSLSEMLHADEPDAAATDAGDLVNWHHPLEMTREKLSQFLRDVCVAEVVSPGRRIDVLLNDLRIERLQLTV